MPSESFYGRQAANNFRNVKILQGIKPNDIIILNQHGEYVVIWEVKKKFRLFGA